MATAKNIDIDNSPNTASQPELSAKEEGTIASAVTPTAPSNTSKKSQAKTGEFGKGLAVGAISACLAMLALYFVIDTNASKIAALQSKLGDTEANYQQLQISTTRDRVARLSGQLNEIENAEVQLVALAAKKQATVEQLTSLNTQLAELTVSPVKADAAAETNSQTKLDPAKEEPPQVLAK